MRKSLESLSEKINIGKRYPGYFNQKIFKSLVFFMVALFVLGLYSNDWRWSWEYHSCSQYNNGPCLNPYYSEDCPLGVAKCSVKFMQPGDVIGEKPSYLADNLGTFEFLLIAIAFLVNHFIWRTYGRRN